MKRIVMFVLAGVCILLLPLLTSCFGTDTSSDDTAPVFVTQQQFSEYQASVNTQFQQMNQTLGSKANTSDVNKSTGLDQQSVQNVVDRSLTGYVKASEVDALIAAYLKANNISGSGESSSDGGNVTGDYGERIDTDGDLELWLERVSGEASDVFTTRDGASTQGRFDIIVVNKDTGSSHDFTISLSLSPDADVNLGTVPSADNKIEVTGGMVFTMTRTDTARNPLLAYQSNTSRITKNDVEDYSIWLTLKQTSSGSSPVEWDYDFSIKDKGD